MRCLKKTNLNQFGWVALSLVLFQLACFFLLYRHPHDSVNKPIILFPQDTNTQHKSSITTAAASSPPPKHRIRWLHIPKTGSGFGNVLVHWACPDIEHRLWINETGVDPALPPSCLAHFHQHPNPRRNWPIGEHYSLDGQRSMNDEDLANVFTMVRFPPGRLASGFHYRTSYKWLGATESTICEYTSTRAMAHYAKSSQTRMILGHPVSVGGDPAFIEKNKILTPKDIETACERLNKFAFVGITDYWKTSLCIFHHQLGGWGDVTEETVLRKREMLPNTRLAWCGDHVDGALYECAMRRFLSWLELNATCRSLFFDEYIRWNREIETALHG